MTDLAMSLFEKATSQDDSKRLMFAHGVGTIISSFPPKFISQEFFPFLAMWIPSNNFEIVRELSQHVDVLASVPEALSALAPVLEALLASENDSIAEIVSEKLKTIPKGSDCSAMLRRLAASPFDYVRAFVSSILWLLPTTEEKRTLCSSLIYDTAFKVRFASCKAIPSLPTELGQQIALSLCNDPSSGIKAFLAVVCTNLPFWFNVVPNIVKDHDWFVRASIAKELPRATSATNALLFAMQLAGDNVWQVILCALNSITEILAKNKIKQQDFVPKIFEILIRTLPYPQTSLKKASIDTFLAIYPSGLLNNDKVNAFVYDIITKQPPTTKLHFMNAVCGGNYGQILKMVHSNIYKVVVSLLSSNQWRVRLGVVQVLSKLSDDAQLKASFSELCLKALNDEATLVREAATQELAEFFVSDKKGKLLPDFYNDLKTSNTFRKRQAAIILLANIAKSSTPEEKAKIICEMKYYENDSCSVVANVARKYIEELH